MKALLKNKMLGEERKTWDLFPNIFFYKQNCPGLFTKKSSLFSLPAVCPSTLSVRGGLLWPLQL